MLLPLLQIKKRQQEMVIIINFAKTPLLEVNHNNKQKEENLMIGKSIRKGSAALEKI